MQWRVMMELTGADGKAQVHEVQAGGGTRLPARRRRWVCRWRKRKRF